jgi:P-type E1-E2 ATPase
MLTISIPHDRELTLQHLVLDLNGTLAQDGALLPGVKTRIERLKSHLTIHLITADTFGGGQEAALELGIHFHHMGRGETGSQKLVLVTALGPKQVVAIGNGANDALMLEAAALGIAVNGGEGMAVAALLAADIVAPDINTALDLLLHPDRIRATLRR